MGEIGARQEFNVELSLFRHRRRLLVRKAMKFEAGLARFLMNGKQIAVNANVSYVAIKKKITYSTFKSAAPPNLKSLVLIYLSLSHQLGWCFMSNFIKMCWVYLLHFSIF